MLDRREYERRMSQARKTFEPIGADVEHGSHSRARFRAHQAAEYALRTLPHLHAEPASRHDLVKLFKRARSVCSAKPGEKAETRIHLPDGMTSRLVTPTRSPRTPREALHAPRGTRG